ncbi:MAG: DUF4249 domain-containing protein [Bacteroidota bacterium]|nr:DUF4249 domain-containing protein [Bacteroidota bacterium]
MKIIHWLLLLLVLGACKDRYNAPVHIPASGYLVVEGFINVGSGSTDITLSRATGLDSPYVIPELSAQVNVESDNGSSYPLTESAGGHYSIDQVPVDLSHKYRLRIKTSLGTEYLSDLSAPVVTREIDSVSWKAGGDGVNIYVSTHGSPTDPRYYQWKFDETWIYTAAFPSPFIYQDYGQLVLRPDPFEVYTCWSSDQSTNIVIASSAKLTTNVIYSAPVTFVSYSTSDKLINKYSILVKQHALTQDWYEWEEKVQKNTEELGSIFDAQPSEITGNIHNTADAAEPVIGFIGCTSETEKRIFISRGQLPFVPIFNPYSDCQKLDTILNNPDSIAVYFGNGYHLVVDQIVQGGTVTHYSGAGLGCMDCRTMGGVTTKPDFWP